MNKCQQIVDGCYECVDCPVPNPCDENQCLNEEGQCCDSCLRACPEGQCLTSVDGCYKCGECGDDDDDDEPTETTSPDHEPTEPTPTEPDYDEPTETTTECTPKEVCENNVDCCGGICSDGVCHKCACTEIDLKSCSTGTYVRTICCDDTKYICDQIKGCFPSSFWTQMDENSYCGVEGFSLNDRWVDGD